MLTGLVALRREVPLMAIQSLLGEISFLEMPRNNQLLLAPDASLCIVLWLLQQPNWFG